ncbi:hypothetical protein [Bermanella sp. R86510]|uniref:hypothetical protein n=1 Tax=unclassified Bermanella TaxID=2627862 RepID=UPI0037C6A6D8
MRFLYPLMTASLLCSSAVVQADYDTLFLDLAGGDAIEHYRIGVGETPKGEDGEKVTSMFYVGYFRSDDIVKHEDVNMGNHEVEVISLGTGGFGYLQDPQKQGGAEFDFEISQSKAESLDYERTAIGFRSQLFLPIAAGFQANVGFNLRPFFLSTDWDDSADLEYEYQAGLEYAFNWDVALYSHYRTLKIITKNDKDRTLAEDVIFGLRVRF